MTLVVFSFFVGVVGFQQLMDIPPLEWVFSIPLFLLAAWRSRFLRLPAVMALGFLWTLVFADDIARHVLPEALAGEDLALEGYVVGLPEKTDLGRRFEFVAESSGSHADRLRFPMRLRLNWYDHVELASGSRWQLTVRLKPPHGFANPGSFDYEAWLFSRGIHATGYVRSGILVEPRAIRLGIDPLRQRLADAVRSQLGEAPAGGLIVALALGERGEIEPAQWDALLMTGTNHLMAISGLHIGLVAAAVFFVTRSLWRLLPALSSRLPAPKAAAWAALASAAGYSALAGFSVPTQRAFVMVAVMMWGLLRTRPLAPIDAFAAAAMAVLIYDPLSVMTPGFWLSFGAVAVLFYGLLGRWRRPGWLKGMLHAQALVFIGLAPFVLALFGQVSLIAPVANFIAVPWVGWVVAPLALVGTALVEWVPGPAGLLLVAAAQLMSWLLVALEAFAQLPLATWNPGALPLWVSACALLGAALVLTPRGTPMRALAAVFWLPLLVLRPPAPADGEVWFTLLDVGQGLAAVVQTARHTLVYDTGPAFGDTFDAGEAVILPYLRYQGIRHVDALVVGHSDRDHAGGLASLLKAIEVERRFASHDASAMLPGSQVCDTSVHWRWDGIDFAFLNPPGSQFPNDNDNSCVLQLRAGNNALLITGDIERRAEQILLNAHGKDLAAAIMVAPHHGSRTSSSEAFLAAVQPKEALFPVGYRNRFNFPAERVVQRYRARGVGVWSTAESGALSIKFDAESEQFQPNAFRSTSRYYWHWKLVKSF